MFRSLLFTDAALSEQDDQLTGFCGVLEGLLGAEPGQAARLHWLVGQLSQYNPPCPQLLAWHARMFGLASLASNPDKNFITDVSTP